MEFVDKTDILQWLITTSHEYNIPISTVREVSDSRFASSQARGDHAYFIFLHNDEAAKNLMPKPISSYSQFS